jgi:hypothetical protein
MECFPVKLNLKTYYRRKRKTGNPAVLAHSQGDGTMKKLLDAIYGLAIILIFGTALLADGLADMPGGFVIMFAAITAAGVLVSVGNRLEASLRRQSRKRPRAGNASDLSHSTIYSSYLQAK